LTEEARFVEERAARWAELRALVQRAQLRGLASLTGAEVRRLGALYRLATTDLAAARSFRFSEAAVQHVNRLCVAAHGLIYAGHAGGAMSRAGALFARGFPATVRRTWRWHAAAALVMLVPAVATYFAMSGNPDLAERTFGTGFQQRAERVVAASGDPHAYLNEMPGLWLPVMSWGIMANNIRVALIGFALGAAAGVGAVVLLAVQGVQLGGAHAIFHDAGVAGALWTFVSAHGPFELSAIFISCGAGMRLGFSMIVPGRRSRAAAFRDTGRESVQMLIGAAAMLVAAGLLEVFLSPTAAPPPVKWSAGAATAAFMVWYFGRPSLGHAADPS
jgi:uncharacterized membrane protein SpoIIM required for sporulation